MPNVAPEVHSLMDRSDASCCCGAAVPGGSRGGTNILGYCGLSGRYLEGSTAATHGRCGLGGGLALAGVMLMRKDEGHSGNTQIPSMKTSFRTRAHCEMTSGLQG